MLPPCREGSEAAFRIGQQCQQSYSPRRFGALGQKARSSCNRRLREAGLDPASPEIRAAFLARYKAAEEYQVQAAAQQEQDDLGALCPLTDQTYTAVFPDGEWAEFTPERRRQIIEADQARYAAEEEAARLEAMTAEQRIDEGSGTPVDRLEVLIGALYELGYRPFASSLGSRYYEIGDARVRVSTPPVSISRERQFGRNDVLIDTSGTDPEADESVDALDTAQLRERIAQIVARLEAAAAANEDAAE